MHLTPNPKPQKDFNSFSQIGVDKSWITLANGMRVIFRPIKKIDLVEVYLRVGAGSNYESEYMGSGISHFVEHAIFLGSKNFPEKDEFSRMIESYGATDFNAYTTTDHTAYFFSVFSRYLEKSLRGLYDFIFHPIFEASVVAEEKGTILSEMDMYKDNANDCYYHFMKYALHKMQPHKFPVIGIRKKFEEIEAADLKSYHKQYYQPSNLVLTLVGNFDLVKVRQQVGAIFKGGTGRPMGYREFRKEVCPLQREFFQTTHARVKFSKFTWIWKTVGLKDQKGERIGLELLSSILAWGVGSILYNELKEKSKLVENVVAHQSTQLESGFFYLTFSLPKGEKLMAEDKSEGLLKWLKNRTKIIEKKVVFILNNLESYMDELLVTGIKESYLNHYIDDLENHLEQAMALSESLVEWGHLNEDQHYLKKISSLTVSDLLKLTQKYLIDDKKKLKIICQTYLLPQSIFKEGKVFAKTKLYPDYESELEKAIKEKKI